MFSFDLMLETPTRSRIVALDDGRVLGIFVPDVELLDHLGVRRRRRRCRPVRAVAAFHRVGGLAGVVFLVEHLEHRLVQVEHHAQAVVGAGRAVGDAARDHQHLAHAEIELAELAFDMARAAELDQHLVEIGVAAEMLRAGDALDDHAHVGALEHLQPLVRLAQHVERPQLRREALAFGDAAQAFLVPVAPDQRDHLVGVRAFPAGHELADFGHFSGS